MDYELLGKRIREERKRLNLTQEKLAERIDLSEAYIGQIERGERILSLDTLLKITDQFGVTVDYLINNSLDLNDDQFLNQLKKIMIDRSIKEKKMILDVLRVMLAHVDELQE
ncbi:helix-turn-helix transcriptional regulator [Paenibacillus sp. BIC5C1]|uniref:helix-turn-helix domain-containing protein n=1 Tax=Paenibacillus sp. BIC5C1 TaxID=3078263 RepID=UPI0028E7EABD|nr:helix-turn-helix transcriptional regulator [Paenibacillus sp. BIC5C1]